MNNYADDEPNVKFCAKRYHSKGWYDKYDVAKVDDELPSESAAHGFSTGTAVTGNVILQLRYGDKYMLCSMVLFSLRSTVLTCSDDLD